MNAKWCISTLIIILSLLGLSQEHKKASNQQISLQFTDEALASDAAHDEVLIAITKKLQILGIDAIEIIKNDINQVSIRYYSDVDALCVKEFLTQDNQNSFSFEDELPFDIPKEQLPEKYSLVVSDIQQQSDTGIILNGNLVLVQKQDFNRIFRPIVLLYNNTIDFKQNALVNVSFTNNRNIAIAIDITSQNIPEVRAGPNVFWNI